MEGKAKTKLFIYGDCNGRTGFGNVLDVLVGGLQKTGFYDISWLGVNYHGDRTRFKDIHVYPVDSSDVYGVRNFARIVFCEKPDIILGLQDVFIFKDLTRIRDENFPHLPIVGWFPIDGNNIPEDWQQCIRALDTPVVYSKYGYDLVKRIMPDLPRLEMIYHGIDHNQYKILPVTERDAKRKQFGWTDKFVVGVFNRFQPRKMIPVVLRAFALFFQGYKVCKKCGNYFNIMDSVCDLNGCETDFEVRPGHPDAVVYLHCNMEEHMMGGSVNNIPLALHSVNLDSQGLVYTPGVDIYNPDLSPDTQEMVRLYNACDVFVSGTIGEGFGLTAVEAMSCGLPVIIPANTTAYEFFGDGRGKIIDSATFINMPFDSGHMRPVFDVPAAVDALCEVYGQWKEKGFIPNYENHYWVKENLNWGPVIQKFHSVIQDTKRRKEALRQQLTLEVF